MTTPPPPWTDADVAALFKHVENGESARTAGDKMGRSRCSVLGKAQRLRLQFSGSNAAVTELTRQARVRSWNTRHERAPNKGAPKPKPKPAFKVVTDVKPQPYTERPNNVVSERPIPLEDLTPWTCRWVTQTDPYLYCGNACTATYCPGHRKLAYVPDDPTE